MNDNQRNEGKVFTVEQANHVLPLIRSIVKDLVELSREVIDRRQRVSELRATRKENSTGVYADELRQAEAELEHDAEQLQEYITELRNLGVEPKSGPDGLVDFPSMIDGRVVYLCWKLGEPEVLHWHELDAGFAGRQPLVAESNTGGEPLDGSSAE
ncbi:MAG TPA: DUF2203 domain-containing protein [Pirellulales bacterium]|jgi:hypothetical protein|nr:DUF2203 domain-containing protein [Pirellulales bacterium]